MFKWKDKKYVNPRKKVFKNLETNEILNLEIQDDPNNVQEESDTPLSAHCLNMAQQELVDDMSKTYTGTNITAPSTVGTGRIKKVYGFCRQEKREGYNLLDTSNLSTQTLNGVTFTPVYDNQGGLKYINVNGTATANTTYTIAEFMYNKDEVYTMVNGLQDNAYAKHSLFIPTYSYWGESTLITDSYKTFTPTATIKLPVQIIVYSTTVMNNVRFYPMLYKGNYDSTKLYEPYGASPSPEHPSSILCVGDDVNLFGAELEQGAIAGNGIDSVNNTRVRTVGYVEIEKGTYAFSCSGGKHAGVYKYDMNNNFIATIVPWTAGNFCFEITEKCKLRFAFMIDNNTAISPKNIGKIKLQKGSVATPWSPYGYGTVENISENKNLAKLEKDSYYRGFATGNLNYNADISSYIARVKPNTTYHTSYVSSNLCYFDKNMNCIKGTAHISNETFNTNGIDNVAYVTVAVEKTNKDKVQIEEGEVATGYVAHQESSNIVYVDKPLCSVGNVRDELDYTKGKITRRCGRIVLNGAESWYMNEKVDDIARFTVHGSKIKSGSHFMCDKLKVVSQTSTSSGEECVQERDISKDDTISIIIKASRLSSVDENGFKAFLKANPITLIYELATPIVEDIDCSNKIVQYPDETTVYNRDNAEIEVSLTNNKAIAEINQNLQKIEELISTLKAGE